VPEFAALLCSADRSLTRPRAPELGRPDAEPGSVFGLGLAQGLCECFHERIFSPGEQLAQRVQRPQCGGRLAALVAADRRGGDTLNAESRSESRLKRGLGEAGTLSRPAQQTGQLPSKVCFPGLV
jgi:hypothetical protein